ncbi:flagellin [Sphaerotilus sp.]|uniref:flagellin N-terminal helical domain-containing protein n=1 Tax=Sphaerotilus sp. TaxID=2093942 RepID=UPI002ACDFBB3|nr:flagellin [Sphaerotilus sp.]MDZ7857631.1 flagellin [Sphaerotilus sp.]
MASTINTNMSSLTAQRALGSTQGSLSTSMQRLSTGLRINSAKDDSAGLAIAERMTAQVKGMAVASRNANDAISLAQTAEGALGKIGESLQRMRELAVQSSNSTNSSSDRANLDEEYQALAKEVTRVIDGTKFNGNNLLNASATDMAFQVGADNVATDAITVSLTDISAGTGMDAVITGAAAGISTSAAALATMSNLDAAIDEVTSARSNLGSVQNRFESVVANLSTTSENLQAAKGRIVDADFAVETSNMSRAQVLQQAGNAMLAQANQAPQQVMSLLR